MFNFSTQIVNAGVRGSNGNGSNRGGGFFNGASCERPKYEDPHPMVVRVMPAINEDGTIDPCYQSNGAFGCWAGFFAGFNYAFEKRSSGVLQRNPQDDSWIREAPYCQLFFSIRKLGQNSATPRFVADYTNKQVRDPLIPGPEQFFPLYCKVLYKGGEEFPNDQFSELQCLVLKANQFILIRDHLMERYSMGAPLDITHPNKGAFLVIWTKKNPVPNGIPKSDVITHNFGENGYSFALVDRFPSIGSSYDGMSSELSQVQMDCYAQVFKPWENIIKYDPDYSNQLAIINERAPANAVLYAFRGYQDWITDDCRRRAMTETPIVPQQQQQYQAPPVQQYQAPTVPYTPHYQAPPVQAPAPPAPAPQVPEAPRATGSAFTGTVSLPRFQDEVAQVSSKVPAHFGSMTDAVKSAATEAMNNHVPSKDPF